MKKILTTIITLLITLSAQSQILYSISGNGLKNKSYIIGTHHLVKGTFADSIPGSQRVLDEISQVCGELDLSDMSNQDTLQAIAKAMIMPGDSSAVKFLSKEKLDTLFQAAKDNYGVDLKTMQNLSMLKMYPAILQMIIPEFGKQLKNRNGNNAEPPQTIIDDYFQKQAQKRGKKVIGLETYKFQIESLTQGLNIPIEEQYQQLIESLQKKEFEKQVSELETLYKKFDITELEKLLKEEADKNKDFINGLLTVRNQNWAKKMPAIMKEKPTLFVVGVGHIIGDQSVLTLLQKQGYKIKPVKK